MVAVFTLREWNHVFCPRQRARLMREKSLILVKGKRSFSIVHGMSPRPQGQFQLNHKIQNTIDTWTLQNDRPAYLHQLSVQDLEKHGCADLVPLLELDK